MEILGFEVAIGAILPVVIVWVLLAVVCEATAKQRGRNRWVWFLFSLVFPFALVIILIQPPLPRRQR